GQEGGAAGSIVGLTAADGVNGSHRGHHQFLSKALAYVHPEGMDPTAEIDATVQEVLQKTLAEILGLAQGYCNGRGGSMHLRWTQAGALGTNAIVGRGARCRAAGRSGGCGAGAGLAAGAGPSRQESWCRTQRGAIDCFAEVRGCVVVPVIVLLLYLSSRHTLCRASVDRPTNQRPPQT